MEKEKLFTKSKGSNKSFILSKKKHSLFATNSNNYAEMLI